MGCNISRQNVASRLQHIYRTKCKILNSRNKKISVFWKFFVCRASWAVWSQQKKKRHIFCLGDFSAFGERKWEVMKSFGVLSSECSIVLL
jgi:hypothetical protein